MAPRTVLHADRSADHDNRYNTKDEISQFVATLLSKSGGTLTGPLDTNSRISSSANDSYFGSGRAGSGGVAHVGSLGTNDAWLEAQSSATNANLQFRAKGTGTINANSPLAASALITGGDTSRPALRLLTSALLGTPVSGGVEYDGTHLYATLGGARRQIDGQWPVLKGEDYGVVADGVTDSAAAIQSMFTALGTNPGVIDLPPGTILINSSVRVQSGNIVIRGRGRRTTTILVGYSASNGAAGVFYFSHTNGTTPVSNVTIQDLRANLNGNVSNVFHVSGCATSSAVTQDYVFDDVEIYGRGVDANGASAPIRLTGTYNGIVGVLSDITFNRLRIHDGTATTSTNRFAASVLVLSDNISHLCFNDCYFFNTYGDTIILGTTGNSSAIRARRDIRFNHCSFYKTKQLYYTTAIGDIKDAAAQGFTGISVNDCTFEDPAGTWTYAGTLSQIYCLMIYQCTNFTVDGCQFNNVCTVIAPGVHSGSEATQSWTFSNNLVVNAISVGDFDGHFAGTYHDNVFYQVGFTQLGGYGQHRPSVFDGNLFYNCGYYANENGVNEYDYALFVLQDGGNVVQNNVVYNDVASGTTKLRYFAYEINGGGYTGYASQPNIYRNNTIYGASGVTVTAFYTNSSFAHYFIGNTGLPEEAIQNRLSGSTVTTTALPATDITFGNYRANGQPTGNSTLMGADVEITDATKGVIRKSPNGTRWRETQNDDGSVTRTAL